jgi:antitoxin CptB
MIAPERKAKINWHCRRGMLELDLILGRFIKHHLDSLTEENVSAFEDLLTNTDPDLYAWLMGYETPARKELLDIVTLIRFHDNAWQV